jgi:hypothetical protein
LNDFFHVFTDSMRRADLYAGDLAIRGWNTFLYQGPTPKSI